MTIGRTVNVQTRLEREKNVAIRNLKALFNADQITTLPFLDDMRHIYHGNGDINVNNEDMEALEEDEDILPRNTIPDTYNHIFPSNIAPRVQTQAESAAANIELPIIEPRIVQIVAIDIPEHPSAIHPTNITPLTNAHIIDLSEGKVIDSL